MLTSSWHRWATALLATALGGCQFERPANIGGPVDAPTIDATEVCTPATATCTDGRYTECDAVGQYVTHLVPNGAVDGSPDTLIMDRYECPMGCHAFLPQCADIDAANGLNAALDNPATSATGLDLVLPRAANAPMNTIVIDTRNYDVAMQATTITDADGGSIRVPALIILQPDGPDIMVLMVRTFTLRPGYAARVLGRRAIAFVSHFDIVVSGTLDLAGRGLSTVGAGSSYAAGCSGFYGTQTAAGGGGGATFGGPGTGGGIPGAAQSRDVTPLQGGCAGLRTGDGGHGGGALQVVSRARIRLDATGLIDVGGGAGLGVAGQIVSGGGSGGSVVFEAPVTSLADGGAIAGRGGSGAALGSDGNVTYGIDGPVTGTQPAIGASAMDSRGGDGGSETTPPGPGTRTGTAQAGGGGSVGRFVVRNRTGIVTLPASVRISRHVGTLPPRTQ